MFIPSAGVQKDASIAAGTRAQMTMAEGGLGKVWRRSTVCLSEKSASLPTFRKEKVFAVRRELAEGNYGICERLNLALDRLMDGLIAEGDQGKMMKKAQADTSKDKVKILIVDDHAIVRQGLTQLVEAEGDLTVSAEAENATQALQAVERQRFDLAIVDISLEGANGLELTEKMKSRCPNMIVLMLSMHDGLLYAQRALQAGAAGYVAKYEAAEKIVTAIRQVLGGKIYVSKSKAVRAMSGAVSVAGGGFDANIRRGRRLCQRRRQ